MAAAWSGILKINMDSHYKETSKDQLPSRQDVAE